MKKKSIEAVGDSAHDLAQDIRTDLANLGADAAKLAAEVIAPRARDLADYVGPRAREMANNVADYVQPRAKDLGQRSALLAQEARDNLQPRLEHLAQEARDNLQPRLEQFAADMQPKIARLASDTRENLQPYLDDARDRLQPLLDDAYQRVEPFVDEGRDRLNRDVMPRLTEVYDEVNALPQTKEAKKRLRSARAALAGELSVPEPAAKRSIGGTIVKLLLATGLFAGVAYALKRFLAPEDSGWQAHEPSPAYKPAPAAPETADAEAPRRAVTEPVNDPEDVQILQDTLAGEALAEATEDAPSAESVAGDADPFVISPYGEGSYVGTEPPAGYAIKGNERSMKYHVEGSGGYDRTIADVWFENEDAATAAGFTKAQR